MHAGSFIVACGLFAAVRAGFSLVVARGLQSTRAQQLWHLGSPVVARGLQSTWALYLWRAGSVVAS